MLVAEDNLDNKEILKRFLSEHGALVELASDGKEAFEKGRSGNYEVILMDVQMPELDGYEAARRLRDEGITSSIIAYTAHAMSDELQKSLAAGCQEFLAKPIDVPRLIRAVHQRRKRA